MCTYYAGIKKCLHGCVLLLPSLAYPTMMYKLGPDP